MRPCHLFTATLTLTLLQGCGPQSISPRVISEDATDLPVSGLSEAWVEQFNEGDARFDLPFRAADGLGPFYIRQACSSCHAGGGRGPGFVEKMAQVEADGVTPVAGQPLIQFGHTVRPFIAAGAHAPLTPPMSMSVKVSQRAGVPVFGRGYLEAIADAEILRAEAEQALRTDGISGRVNRVTFASEQNTDSPFTHPAKGDTNLIGRFGLKARIATLDDFTADALQGDMGLTSPMRPVEPPNPENLADDDKPGIDTDLANLNFIANYMRTLAIPKRSAPDARGQALFDSLNCSVCHARTLKTRADYPLVPLAGLEAPVYSDLLLHDMGPSLADGLEDGSATSREWRTAPLIGLRFLKSFLHDSRATTIDAAIVQHGAEGSEARASVTAYLQLPPEDREVLLSFVKSL